MGAHRTSCPLCCETTATGDLMKSIVWLVLSFLLSSCIPRTLEVQTKHISHESLASSRVGSPDPLLEVPYRGEKLFIQWYLTKNQWKQKPIYLSLRIRFRNFTEENINLNLRNRKGYTLYTILNDSFSEKKGILAYKVELYSSSSTLATWIHPLWTEWITLTPP